MTTAIRTRKSKKSEQKTVQIIARIQFKADSRKVVYLVRGSHGEQYETSLFDGKASACTCPAHKPCYHMVQLGAREAARAERAVAVEQAEAYLRESIDTEAQLEQWTAEEEAAWEAEHAAWKLANGLAAGMLSREQYVAEFNPDGLSCA